jgi:acyl carrier protein
MLSEQSVKQIIAELIDVDEERLTVETQFSSIDGWDSVNALRLLVFLEREVGSSLDYDRFMKCERIGDLVSLLKDKGVLAAPKASLAS